MIERMDFTEIPSEYSHFVFNQKRVPGMEFVCKVTIFQWLIKEGGLE